MKIPGIHGIHPASQARSHTESIWIWHVAICGIWLWYLMIKSGWNFQILHGCFLGRSCLCWQATCRVLTSAQVGNKTKPMRAVAAWSLWAFNNLESNGSAIWLNGKKQAWTKTWQKWPATYALWEKRTYIYIFIDIVTQHPHPSVTICYNNVWWCLILTILNQIPTTSYSFVGSMTQQLRNPLKPKWY